MRPWQQRPREELPLRHEPGWRGAFTRKDAAGAIPAGTPVIKVNAEEGDSHPNGTPGIILGSISHPEVFSGAICYFIEWAPSPRVAVGTMQHKVQRA